MIRNIYRKLKYQFIKLLRATGAPSIIARSFSLGIFIEFITLPTLGMAFLLLYPLNILFRGNFAASIIGYIIGKFIFPLFFVINMKVGTWLTNGKAAHIQQIGESSQSTIFTLVKTKGIAFFVGSATTGLVLALFCYGLVFYGLIHYRNHKKKRRMAIHLKSKENLVSQKN